MKVLLTGATGYIGKRLLPVLIEQGHEVVCCVRDKKRFPTDGIYKHTNVSVFEVDFFLTSATINKGAKNLRKQNKKGIYFVICHTKGKKLVRKNCFL